MPEKKENFIVGVVREALSKLIVEGNVSSQKLLLYLENDNTVYYLEGRNQPRINRREKVKLTANYMHEKIDRQKCFQVEILDENNEVLFTYNSDYDREFSEKLGFVDKDFRYQFIGG